MCSGRLAWTTELVCGAGPPAQIQQIHRDFRGTAFESLRPNPQSTSSSWLTSATHAATISLSRALDLGEPSENRGDALNTGF
jgi:hypothetical protein